MKFFLRAGFRCLVLLAAAFAVYSTLRYINFGPANLAAASNLGASLIINEVHADPHTSLGDANGDGTVSASDDEFVELYNNSATPVDISGYQLSDSAQVRHVFPAGTFIPANCSIVVFGGGNPTGTFGNSWVQSASTGSMALNNAGDSVLLANSSGTPVALYGYGPEGGNDTSLTRFPDITGPETFVQHLSVSALRFSPGTMLTGASFSGCSSTPTPTATPTPPPSMIIVNEIHADPHATLGDANGDGTVVPSQDQFVELYNAFEAPVDMSGYQLMDDMATRHIFPPGTIVPSHCSIVVFGGGTPSGTFGNSWVQTASSGSLALGITGDTLRLTDSGGTPLLLKTYGPEGGNDTSLTRFPDITGPETFVQHLSVSALRFSPGTMLTGASFSGCSSTPTPTATPTPPPLMMIFNEIHADPHATLGDANGDGTVDPSQDEFIELYNAFDAPADISGYWLMDDVTTRHVFPMGTIVPAHCSIVVFGGGMPTGIFGNALVQTASTGALGLNNIGDSIWLIHSSGTPLALTGYGPEGGNDTSLTRFPDITGPESFVQHLGVSSLRYSPGTLVTGGTFSGCPSTPTPTATPTPTPTPIPTGTAYDNSGTFMWTCPTGVTSVTVEAWGGGGSGGSATNGTVFSPSSAGGGGGGAYARSTVSVTPGAVYTVMVGLGGPPVTGTAAGQASSFGTTAVIAAGGSGGSAVSGGGLAGTGGQGGTVANSIGDIRFAGGRGGNGIAGQAGAGGGGGSSAGTNSNGADGMAPSPGVAPTGGGTGGPGTASASGAGGGGQSPGGGGGGSRSVGSLFAGGAGAQGRVVITYHASPAVSGRVTYENTVVPDLGVPNATLAGAGSPSVMTSTDSMGNYSLTGLGGGSYTVTPSKVMQPSTTLNGIFANDAALIARHVVGLVTLNPAQLKAAMVAGNPFATSQDAALIARYIVGVQSGGNQTGQWKFTPANRMYASVAGTITGQDYAGTLMGDVSGDWSPLVMGPSLSMLSADAILPWDALLVSVPQFSEAALGKEITIPIRLDNVKGADITSFQFDFEYDPNVVTPSKIAADISGTLADGLAVVSNVVEPGLIKVVVFGAIPVTGDGVYVDLRFNAAGRPGSSSKISITGFRHNDGTEPVVTANGIVTITSVPVVVSNISCK